MPVGKCLILDKDGNVTAIVVDYGHGTEMHIDIPFYEEKGYAPDWRSLMPCQLPKLDN